MSSIKVPYFLRYFNFDGFFLSVLLSQMGIQLFSVDANWNICIRQDAAHYAESYRSMNWKKILHESI